MIQRRLYIYIVAAASFGMVLIGLINLGTTVLDQVLNATPPYSNVRDAYAGFGAVILVGLPVWGIHWWIAQRLAHRNADERASAIRRLYLYVVLTATGIAIAVYLRRLIEDTVGFVLGTSSDGASISRALWAALVVTGFWLYHFRTAHVDRSNVGESGVAATLRRWYAYGLLFFGLAFLLFGARNVLQQIWVLLVDRGQVIAPGGLVPTALATMLTGLLIWGFHSQWTSRAPIAQDDQRSTLRAVQRFLALTGSVALTLFGASQLLYYALARLLGIEHPGGVTTSIVVAVASPAATAIVFGLAWLWIQRQLAADAGATEATRQAGVRHLYTHLVAFLALATLAIGAAGILWTLSDQIVNSLLHHSTSEWRDKISLFVTLVLVGAPMWFTHWRQSPALDERHTLSRRLYLYATLLGSVLAALISGAIFVYRLLALVLGTSDAASGAPVIDMGRAMSVILVAAAIGLYHWRVLRSDSAARPAIALVPGVPSPVPRGGQGGGVVVIITGATEEQVREALSKLPDGANYTIQR
jgi:Domain of unknown function (DUF5671)